MKIIIRTDMEGISGIFSWEQVTRNGSAYEAGRKNLMEDVNAAVEGCLAGGASEVYVSDNHDAADNIVYSALHPAAKLLAGSTRRLEHTGSFCGYDGLCLIGYHAREGHPGVLAHSFSSRLVARLILNDRPFGEAEFAAAMAGWDKTPLLMVSGDDMLRKELEDLLPKGVYFAVVKKFLSYQSADCMPLEKTRQLIREQAEAAVKAANQIRPFTPEGPFRMQLGFKFAESAEKAAMIPCLRREDLYTVSYQADNLIEIRKALLAAIALAER